MYHPHVSSSSSYRTAYARLHANQTAMLTKFPARSGLTYVGISKVKDTIDLITSICLALVS